MPLNLDKIGQPIGPTTHAYQWKDVVLYALGVGAGFEELSYCYEKKLQVIPSFAITAVYEFFWQAIAASEANLAGILHGEQELRFHRPMPIEGDLRTTGAIGQLYDKGAGKGALIVVDSETRDADGHALFSSTFTLFARLDGGFGGPNAPAPPFEVPDRAPDHTMAAQPTEDHPLLYRLSGDYFDLHVDPDFARAAGFEKPIMHGLCTYGFACRALIQALCPGKPETVRRLGCRFSKPLYPGIAIETHIWQMAAGRAHWRTLNAETGEIVIDRGTFEYN